MDMKDFYYAQLDSVSILKSSINHYLTIFLPVLSALPFAAFFSAERTSGYIRFNIIRIGKFKYYISKFISALVSGGLAIMLGYVLYSFVILNFFSFEGVSLISALKLYIGTALYGAVSVLPAFFLSSFIKNKYIVCCLPFIFMHFYYTLISRIQSFFINNEKFEIVFKMNFLFPINIRNIFDKGNNNLLMLIYYGGLEVIFFVGFAVIMNRRCDLGE